MTEPNIKEARREIWRRTKRHGLVCQWTQKNNKKKVYDIRYATWEDVFDYRSNPEWAANCDCDSKRYNDWVSDLYPSIHIHTEKNR